MANVKDQYADMLTPDALEVPDAAGESRLASLLGDDQSAAPLMRLIESVEHFNAFERIPSQGMLPSLSLEDLDGGQKASLITRIIEWLRSVMKALFDEMNGLEKVALYLPMAAEQTRHRSRDRGVYGNHTSSSFTVKTRVNNLCVRYSPLDTVNELYSHLRVLDNVVRTYYAYDPLAKLTEVTHVAQASRDPELLAQALSRIAPTAPLGTKVFFPHPETDGWLATGHLLGNHRLVIKQRENSEGIEALLGNMVRLTPSALYSPGTVPAEIEFTRFGLVQSDQVLDLVINLAKYLAQVNTGSVRSKRTQGLDQLGRVLKKLQVDMALSSADTKVTDQIGVCAALLEQYIDWIVNPYNGLYGLTCRNLRAALNVCELNAQ